MKKILVYDLPTRAFHWVFTGLFLIAFLIAKNVDDETLIFSYHMLAGILLTWVVLLRIVWGFIGSKYALFSSFEWSFSSLKEYFVDMIKGKTKLYLGHNPASSWAAAIMILLVIGLGITGFLMSVGPKKPYKEIHEWMANGLLFVSIAHFLGIVLHTIRHRDPIGASMVTGIKISDRSVAEGLTHPSYITFGVSFVLVCGFGWFLMSRFQPDSRTLDIAGYTLQLGELEDHKGEHDEDHD